MQFAFRILLGIYLTVWGITNAKPTIAAESYPKDVVKIVVPYSPGGSTDLLGREIARDLGNLWGQSVIVENKPGAGSLIGVQSVAQAKPDGYTILLVSAHYAINPALHKDPGYDPLKSFDPVSLVALVPILVVKSKNWEAKSIEDVIAYAKKHPGELNFGSSGVGGAAHLSGELLKSMAGIDIVHVPYKGAAPAMTALIAGQVHLMFDGVSTATQNVRAGNIEPVAWAGKTRTDVFPEIPTVSESGVPGYSSSSWFGVFVPAGTPDEVVKKINADIAKVVNKPEFVKKQKSLGIEIKTSSPSGFVNFIEEETVKWEKVIKEANIKKN